MTIKSPCPILFTLMLALVPGAAAGATQAPPDEEVVRSEEEREVRVNLDAERASSIAEAQRSMDEAARAMDDARRRLEEGRGENAEQIEGLRQDLSRAHRTLRDASREVARTHRKLMHADREHIERIRVLNLGDRAVIGVLLGPAGEAGIEIAGVSPDGPAERAGLQAGDVLVAIDGVDLVGRPGAEARAKLFEFMDGVEDGQEVPIEVERDGKRQVYSVAAEQREPVSWQSLVQLPPPAAPGAPEAHSVLVERIEVPDIDYEQLADKINRIEEQLERFDYRFIGEDGEVLEFSHEYHVDGKGLSAMGRHALSEANMLFGMPHMSGLELAALDPDLGRYFKTERGVLVIRAEGDNVYGLQSGDVILTIAGTEVDRPSDVLRALRDAEPGSEVEMAIKRDRRDRTLKATVPENRLGALHPDRP